MATQAGCEPCFADTETVPAGLNGDDLITIDCDEMLSSGTEAGVQLSDGLADAMLRDPSSSSGPPVKVYTEQGSLQSALSLASSSGSPFFRRCWWHSRSISMSSLNVGDKSGDVDILRSISPSP